MSKKFLEGKTGEAGFVHDTPEQILQCLSCSRKVCIDCFDMKAPPSEEVDYNRPLLPHELMLLSVYASCANDQEISDATGIPKPKVFRSRKSLGLPPANILSALDRQAYVDAWMRE